MAGRSRFVARRLGTLGVVAVVAGAMLVGSGVALSGLTPKAAAASVPAKKTTTTSTSTTTSTTVATSTTTTQPCNAVPTTATGTNSTTNATVTVTMTPGTCLVSGSVVTLSGSGFVDGSAGAMLECNSATQPTVHMLGNDVPVSCTNPLSKLVTISGTGTFGPVQYTVNEGVLGPPCGTACTGTEATDSSGGSTTADAAKFPCLPSAPAGTCGIVYGDLGNDAITIPLAFNPNIAPSPTTTVPTTAAPAVAPGNGVSAAKPRSTATSPGALAFTGTGPGLWWLALVGMVLMVLGIVALALVDQPRRIVRLALSRVTRSRPPST